MRFFVAHLPHELGDVGVVEAAVEVLLEPRDERRFRHLVADLVADFCLKGR